MQSTLPIELIRSYEKSHYVVSDTDAFVLRIAEHSEALRSLHARLKATSSAFLTACAPFSQETSQVDNDFLQSSFEDELMRDGFHFVRGFGHGDGDESHWVEKSALVLSISLEQASNYATKHRQNAFVWCDENCIPKLVLMK